MRPTPGRKIRICITFFLTAFSLTVIGCAEGSVESVDAGGGSDDASSSQADMTMEEMGRPDMGGADMSDPCGVCCPQETTCSDETTVGVCRADGSGFDEMPCGEDEECMNGECVVPPVCSPGETKCFDTQTVLTCRASGEGWATMPCDGENVCFDGQCVSGDPPGTPCDDDSTCATLACHCGSGTDEMCPGSPTTGYCTVPTCMADTCGDDGACFAADIAPLGDMEADHDHCVKRCDSGTCDATGLDCVEVPIRTADGVGWQKACYFEGVADIGEECSDSGSCIGECLTGYFSDQPGYCTRRCDDDGACPDGTACIELNSGSGEFWCSVLCGDGSVTGSDPCPFDTTTRFDVTCASRSTQAGGVVRACVAN